MNPEEIARNRAQMPTGTNTLLDQRTVEHSYRSLLTILKEGLNVLDVGCGSGAITKGMADKVGSTGKVIGLDISEQLIAIAKENYKEVQNLEFVAADIHAFTYAAPFDLITSARTLQWQADPFRVIQKMKALLAEGGWLSILDYNHEKISWTPAPPPSMQLFYQAFLKWRADASMENDIADRAADYLKNAGFTEVRVIAQSEVTKRCDNLTTGMDIWTKVAETRGKQMVTDGYVTEEQRLDAIRDYTIWVEEEGERMEMYLLAVEGKK